MANKVNPRSLLRRGCWVSVMTDVTGKYSGAFDGNVYYAGCTWLHGLMQVWKHHET